MNSIREIFKNEDFDLPIRWDGIDFYHTIYEHLKKYQKAISIVQVL